jgi:hypothetical protein
MMANMPGFESAVALVREHPSLRDRIGVHLNLTEGRPLTRPILDCPLFCGADGFLASDREHPLFRLSRKERDAAYTEMKAQLERVLAAGIRPTHLDSHHHIHTEWALAPLVCRLADEYQIPRIRLTRNIGRPPAYPKRIYKHLFNRWRLTGPARLKNTDYFGDIGDLLYFSEHRWPDGKTIEVMVHPLFDEKGGLVDLDRKDLRRRLTPILKQPIDLRPKPITA